MENYLTVNRTKTNALTSIKAQRCGNGNIIFILIGSQIINSLTDFYQFSHFFLGGNTFGMFR